MQQETILITLCFFKKWITKVYKMFIETNPKQSFKTFNSKSVQSKFLKICWNRFLVFQNIVNHDFDTIQVTAPKHKPDENFRYNSKLNLKITSIQSENFNLYEKFAAPFFFRREPLSVNLQDFHSINLNLTLYKNRSLTHPNQLLRSNLNALTNHYSSSQWHNSISF